MGMTSDYKVRGGAYLVPPHLYRELDEQTWYEQGELREHMLWRKKL